MSDPRAVSAWEGHVLRSAAADSLRKLDPRRMARNPVMFVVEIGSVLTTLLWGRDLAAPAAGSSPAWFSGSVTLWLWFTVLFANFAEALAEGRGKAQAAALRGLRRETDRPPEVDGREERAPPRRSARATWSWSRRARRSPATARSSRASPPWTSRPSPGSRRPSSGRAAATARRSPGGTKVLSDRIVIRIGTNPGESFLDRMIGLVEGAKRQKTPNEIALTVLLAGMTILFLIACVTLVPFGLYSGLRLSTTVIVALLVCLIPTTIGGLLSAIGIAGMDRLIRHNVIPMSGRAVEAAGDVDMMLLDKTGTITLGSRMATRVPARPRRARRAAGRRGPAREPRRRDPGGPVDRRPRQGALRPAGPGAQADTAASEARFVPFSAQTRMSGCDLDGRVIRKGAADAIARHVRRSGAGCRRRWTRPRPRSPGRAARRSPSRTGPACSGVVHLKDVVKGGIKERFARFRAMGLRTVMITGDNPLTAAAIAAEAGVDDFLAEATPEMKLALIREEQAKGKLVAMTGDGTNDAPALAQADVAIAMNTGTQAAREAGNMVDLDSNPTKLLEVVEVGKQLLMTRGCLTTFSIANDVAKYFAILPALFLAAFPQIAPLNVMGLTSPESAILSAVDLQRPRSSWRSSRSPCAACATARWAPPRSSAARCSSTASAGWWRPSWASSSSTSSWPRSASSRETGMKTEIRSRSA